MNAHRKGIQLSAEEQVEIFGTIAFSDEYAAEAEERWGGTDAWKQSRQRPPASPRTTGCGSRPRRCAAEGAGRGQAHGRDTGIGGRQRAGDATSRFDRAVLRLRRLHAQVPGRDVSGRRAVHPLLRRRRTGAGAVPARHSDLVHETNELLDSAFDEVRKRELHHAGAAMSTDGAISYTLANISDTSPSIDR